MSKVTVDASTRQIEIAFGATSLASRPLENGPVKIISLPDMPAGEWLTRLNGTSGPASASSLGIGSAFVLQFP